MNLRISTTTSLYFYVCLVASAAAFQTATLDCEGSACGSYGGLCGEMQRWPMHFDVRIGFGPPELPPRKRSPVESSLPLIPADLMATWLPNRFPERNSLGGVVDVASGLSMVQQVDFELPFGSAVFRHVRTYSPEFKNEGIEDAGRWSRWDWNGLGWMMSEQPFLLFDAQWDFLDREKPVAETARRIYFFPDSFHAIPFEMDDAQGDGIYAAPPWMDALLGHNGTLNDGEWSALPSEIYIWLYRSAVKYTFDLHFEDQLETDPDYGYPAYGLVSKIEDRYGNTIEYEYCADPEREECESDFCRFGPTCCQECNSKGQIKAIRLRAAPTGKETEGPVVWTLLYVYRGFFPDNVSDTEQRVDRFLHSIHVYAGEPGGIPQNCLTIPAEVFCASSTPWNVDAGSELSLPDDWVLEARYTYGNHLESGCSSSELFRVDGASFYAPGILALVNIRRIQDEEILSEPSLYFYEASSDTWMGEGNRASAHK